jgi:hypothetical protein
MTSSSRDPAAIPTRRDPLTAQLAAIGGFVLACVCAIAWGVLKVLEVLP